MIKKVILMCYDVPSNQPDDGEQYDDDTKVNCSFVFQFYTL